MGQPNYVSSANASASALTTAQGNLTTLIANGATAVINDAGSVFTIKSTKVSSAILVAGVDITAASSGGALELIGLYVQTDGTGLATGTLLNVVHNNAKGAPLFFSSVVTGLGANKTVTLAGASVLGNPFVLESGAKLTAKSTVLDMTGAGTADFYMTFRRVAAGASIAAA